MSLVTLVDIPACWLDRLAEVDGVGIQDKEGQTCCYSSYIADARSGQTQSLPYPSSEHYLPS